MQDLVPRRRQRYLLRQPTNPNPLSCSSEEALQKEQPTENQNKALLVSFVNHGSFGQRPLTLGEKEKNALSLSLKYTRTHTHIHALSLFASSRHVSGEVRRFRLVTCMLCLYESEVEVLTLLTYGFKNPGVSFWMISRMFAEPFIYSLSAMTNTGEHSRRHSQSQNRSKRKR